MSECGRKTRLLTGVLILLRATAVLDGFHELLHGLVAQRGQIGGHVFAEQPYLGGRHQRENVLHVGNVLRPELIPEIVVLGADGLQHRQPGQRVRAKNRIRPPPLTWVLDVSWTTALRNTSLVSALPIANDRARPTTANQNGKFADTRRFEYFDTNAIWRVMARKRLSSES